jgi:hypothetical protein
MVPALQIGRILNGLRLTPTAIQSAIGPKVGSLFVELVHVGLCLIDHGTILSSAELMYIALGL